MKEKTRFILFVLCSNEKPPVTNGDWITAVIETGGKIRKERRRSKKSVYDVSPPEPYHQDLQSLLPTPPHRDLPEHLMSFYGNKSDHASQSD